ncbi:MAG: DUF1501 domain-containing protein [Planctomycetes bacterium]|nr:DUF1501 domain-containing protein [Planctomycetota bacterium]
MSEHQISNRNNLSGQVNRRSFLSDCGKGLTGIALADMLSRDGVSRNTLSAAEPHLPSGLPHIAPKAKSVIWYFMMGGTSHMESFDPKPALNKYSGLTIGDSEFNALVTKSPYYRKNVRDFSGVPRKLMGKLYPLQVSHRKWGECGTEISDWWQHLGTCADEMAVVRSMWTTDNDHAAQLQFHTGRHIFDGFFPSIGSWIHYGLGSLNDNLPQYIVMGSPPGDCCGGEGANDGSYLGPEHSGVKMSVNLSNPLPFGSPGGKVYKEERRSQLELLGELNSLAGAEYPNDPEMRARIKSYELAFRMQMAVPEVVKISDETAATQEMYGLNNKQTKAVGQQSLIARRLVERGVRFIQIYNDGWDAHNKLKKNHSQKIGQVDKPIAGLLKDLKQRGLLDETLVVWGTEFGRTPGSERADGRDHHPYGFSVWMAGGGIKGGVVHGATDEIGFHAVENRHYVTDLHATVLHQLGLDPRKLEVPGHKRLDVDFGEPIKDIIA